MQIVHSCLSFFSCLIHYSERRLPRALSPSELAEVDLTVQKLSQGLIKWAKQNNMDVELKALQGKIKKLSHDLCGWKGLFYYFFHYAYYQKASEALNLFHLLSEKDFSSEQKAPLSPSPIKGERLFSPGNNFTPLPNTPQNTIFFSPSVVSPLEKRGSPLLEADITQEEKTDSFFPEPLKKKALTRPDKRLSFALEKEETTTEPPKKGLEAFFKNKLRHPPKPPTSSPSPEELHKKNWAAKIQREILKRANPEIFYDEQDPPHKFNLEKEKEEKERDLQLFKTLPEGTKEASPQFASWVIQKENRLKQLQELIKPDLMPIREKDRLEKIVNNYRSDEIKTLIGLYFDWQPLAMPTDDELSKNYYQQFNKDDFLTKLFKEKERLEATSFAKEALQHKEEWNKYLKGGGLNLFASVLEARAKQLKQEPNDEVPPFQKGRVGKTTFPVASVLPSSHAKSNFLEALQQPSNRTLKSTQEVPKKTSEDPSISALVASKIVQMRKFIQKTPEKPGDVSDTSFNS